MARAWPRVTVVVDVQTLQGRPGAAPATLDRLGAVSAETALPLAATLPVTRVVMAGAAQVLEVGRATRVVTVAQRRALAVREGRKRVLWAVRRCLLTARLARRAWLGASG